MPKSQTGFAPIVLIIIAVVITATVGGYVLLNKGAVSLPGAPGLTLNANCKFNDPDLCKFVNNWKTLNQYSAKSITTPKSGAKTEVNFEISGEDKFHMLTIEAGKEIYNVISIGDTTYTKDNTDNKWWKQKSPKQTQDLKNQSEFKVEESSKPEEDKTTYKKITKEVCGSRQCFKYQTINPDLGDATEYIWFDDREYLLRKTSSESKELGLTVSEYSYDKLNIVVPSPTKDAAPGQIIVPSGSAVTTLDNKTFEELKKNAENDVQKTVPIMREENIPADVPVDNSSTEDSGQ